jgi:predicted ATPase
MREAMDEFEAHEWSVWRPYFGALLADRLCTIGNTEEALSLLDEALEQIEETGERCQESEVNRIKGETLLALPDPDFVGAERAFKRSALIAQKQDAKLYELRSLVGLGRLLQKQGRGDEVRDMLGKCYTWFSDGLESPELGEARVLLEGLRSR